MKRLNEEWVLQNQEANISKVFRKVDAYNKRSALYESRKAEVYFTLSEQEAVRDILLIMKQRIYDSYIDGSFNTLALNEGLWDDIKQKGKNAVNTVKDKVTQLTGDAKKAMQFIDQIISKGITKVSEFIEYIVGLLEKLGNTVKEAIVRLGDIKSKDDENSFLNLVQFYVAQRRGNKSLTESLGILFEEESDGGDTPSDAGNQESDAPAESQEEQSNDNMWGKMLDFTKKHKALSWIFMGREVNGKKLSIWKTILVSIVGSLVINLGIGGLLVLAGVPVTTMGTIVSVIMIIWQCRGILRILLNRKAEMRQTGETKMLNRSTVIQLLISVGIMVIFHLPPVKAFMGELINRGVDKLDQWSGNKISEWLSNHNSSAVTERELPPTTHPVETPVPVDKPATITDELADKINKIVSNGMGDQKASVMARYLSSHVTIPEDGVKVFVANGDANLIHSYGSIKELVQNAGGKIVTSVSENDFGKTYILTVILPDDTDMEEVLRGASDTALHNAGATISKFLPLECAGQEITPPVPPIPPVPNIIHDIDLSKLFQGIGMAPMYDNTLGHMIKIKFFNGIDPEYEKNITITEIKQMSWAKMKEGIAKIKITNADAISEMNKDILGNIEYAKDLANLYKDYVEEMEETTDGESQEIMDLSKLIEGMLPYKNIDETKCTVFYTTLRAKTKDGGYKVHTIPLFVMSEYCLKACTLLAPKYVPNIDKTYYFRGMMNDNNGHAVFNTINTDDTKTHKRMVTFLTELLYKNVKDLATVWAEHIGLNKDAETKLYVMKNGAKALRFPQIGNFTGEEILDILNNPKDCYKYYFAEDNSDVPEYDGGMILEDRGEDESDGNNDHSDEDYTRTPYIHGNDENQEEEGGTDVPFVRRPYTNEESGDEPHDEEEEKSHDEEDDDYKETTTMKQYSPLFHKKYVTEPKDEYLSKTLKDSIRKFLKNEATNKKKNEKEFIRYLSEYKDTYNYAGYQPQYDCIYSMWKLENDMIRDDNAKSQNIVKAGKRRLAHEQLSAFLYKINKTIEEGTKYDKSHIQLSDLTSKDDRQEWYTKVFVNDIDSISSELREISERCSIGSYFIDGDGEINKKNIAAEPVVDMLYELMHNHRMTDKQRKSKANNCIMDLRQTLTGEGYKDAQVESLLKAYKNLIKTLIEKYRDGTFGEPDEE